jgi:hypothetical protein
VIIKVERSGGFAAIPKCSEIDIKNLPSELIPTAKKIMRAKKSYSLPMMSPPKGAADYYTYKILIQDGVKRRIIECNQFNIQNDLKSLVKYVERNSKEKVKTHLDQGRQ